MSGSRLGRGRGGRLAIYAGCGVLVFFLVFLYRAANSEMTRLRELHLKCAQQQEALAAQLQVIFEYKARLEKSLAEEKSSNAAVKQELQQRASREKSLRDKDSVEAMQRFNSLQQTYKLLQTEHQDLQEECKKHEKQALDETSRLETTLQDLRSRIRQTQEEKMKSIENLKTKYMNLQVNMQRLQVKYNEQMNIKGDTIMQLQKEVSQLKHELEKTKNSYVRSTSPSPSLVSPEASVIHSAPKEGSQPIPAPQQQQQQQQVSSPQPLHAPRDNRADGAAQLEEKLNDDANEPAGDIRFVQRDGNIVPADASDLKEVGGEQSPQLVNDLQQRQHKNVVERPDVAEKVAPADDENGDKNSHNEEQNKQSVVHDAASSRRAGNTSTVASANNGNMVSPSLDKAPSPHRPKVKLPIGVLPIPEIREDDKKPEETHQEETRKRDDAVHNSPPKFVPANPDSKEKEAIVEAGNLDPPFVANPPARHVGEQIERRANDGWFKVGPGVQEVGEELNRVPRLDDGQANADDQYDGGEYDKEPQQKNDIRLAEGEDEGEDEGDLFEYPDNLNQGKRE
ncbi:Golgi integral membrane protein 4-like isoform X1 [Odontomachus brunneus]|uniref:Golgi integral membrane protein 4-like isoform X1 n=1 Tax=Odontomachus brunneus TaxID=486640 RepID=UPI0013F28724|nr:Golgi integral membrane protein 4-like isoform X1 [Odontomachus brunneus]XP_032684874.1 Golgi integral membrane protein 4-like isoform X1 [Odontomachus brunneus]